MATTSQDAVSGSLRVEIHGESYSPAACLREARHRDRRGPSEHPECRVLARGQCAANDSRCGWFTLHVAVRDASVMRPSLALLVSSSILCPRRLQARSNGTRGTSDTLERYRVRARPPRTPPRCCPVRRRSERGEAGRFRNLPAADTGAAGAGVRRDRPWDRRPTVGTGKSEAALRRRNCSRTTASSRSRQHTARGQ